MLKRDPRCRFVRHGWLFIKYVFYIGNKCTEKSGAYYAAYNEPNYLELLKKQKENPIQIFKDHTKGRAWWMFKDQFFWENEGCTPDEVKALILAYLKKRESMIRRAQYLAGHEESVSTASRDPIPDEVKIFVWRRDGGRCVKCGSQENLEFDHIIPLSKGGSNTERNIQLLCQHCNRSKGDSLF
jgi:hypothetical protein